MGITEGGVREDQGVFIIKGGVSDRQDIKTHPRSIIIKALMVFLQSTVKLHLRY